MEKDCHRGREVFSRQLTQDLRWSRKKSSPAYLAVHPFLDYCHGVNGCTLELAALLTKPRLPSVLHPESKQGQGNIQIHKAPKYIVDICQSRIYQSPYIC